MTIKGWVSMSPKRAECFREYGVMQLYRTKLDAIVRGRSDYRHATLTIEEP